MSKILKYIVCGKYKKLEGNSTNLWQLFWQWLSLGSRDKFLCFFNQKKYTNLKVKVSSDSSYLLVEILKRNGLVFEFKSLLLLGYLR